MTGFAAFGILAAIAWTREYNNHHYALRLINGQDIFAQGRGQSGCCYSSSDALLCPSDFSAVLVGGII